MGKIAVFCTKLTQNRVSRVFPALLLTISLILMGCAGTGHADECEKLACGDDVYRDGYCHSGPDPISRAISHREARCDPGWALDYERGTCIKEGCCEKSVCLPDETYRGAVEYRGEIRGDCDSPPGAFGVDSHALRPCESGWDLDRERGVCVERGCKEAKITPSPTGVARPADEVVRKPDLTAKSFELAKTGVCISGGSLFEFRVKVTNSGTADAPPTGSTPMLRVFNAANIGWATEVPLDPLEQGTFQNLIVPVRYASRYRGLVSSSDFLGFTIKVDHRNLVDELNEDNNIKTIKVRVPEQCKPIVDVPSGVETLEDKKLPDSGIKKKEIKKIPVRPLPFR